MRCGHHAISIALGIALGSGLLCAPLAAQQRLTLEQLAQLARKRYEAVAASQREAVKPFLSDLDLSYAANRDHLDRRFAQMAELGDGIVPLLLERLRPGEEGDILGRTVAENSARVLRLIGPGGFVDPLLELLAGPSYTARLLAIELLGASGSSRAARRLAKILPSLHNQQLRAAIESLTTLEYVGAGSEIAKHLRSDRPAVRRAAMRYLAVLHPPEALAATLAAMRAAPDHRHLDLFLDYLRRAAPQHPSAADALCELLGDASLDRLQRADVVQALADVAPKGHAAAIAACKQVLTDGETGRLGLACALTMRKLGSNAGIDRLLSDLKAQMAKDRRTAEPYIDRGDLYMELGEWAEASRDFLKALRLSENYQIEGMLQLRVARCEAHRERYAGMVRALRESNQTYSSIQRVAREDEIFAAALRRPEAKRFLDQLSRGR